MKKLRSEIDRVIERRVMSVSFYRNVLDLDRIPGHTMDYLDSAIPRKRAKKRKGLIQSGWLVSCCRLVGLAVKMDEAARYEILSKRSSGH